MFSKKSIWCIYCDTTTTQQKQKQHNSNSSNIISKNVSLEMVFKLVTSLKLEPVFVVMIE